MSDTPEEQKRVDEEWQKVLQIFDDAKLHPVCPKVLMILLAEDMQSFRHDWTKPMVEQFWKFMDPTFAEKTHRKAIDDLIRISHYVNTKLERPLLATGLLVLLNEAIIKWKLVDMEAQATFDKNADAAPGKAVTGGKDRAVPAKVGEKAPEGSVRPDQLVGSKRRI